MNASPAHPEPPAGRDPLDSRTGLRPLVRKELKLKDGRYLVAYAYHTHRDRSA